MPSASQVARTWPGGFLAHHYTRYLGDLSGGRSSAGRPSKCTGSTTMGCASIGSTTSTTRANTRMAIAPTLDTAPWSEAERRRIIEESRRSFRMTGAMLGELDPSSARSSVPDPSVPDVASPSLRHGAALPRGGLSLALGSWPCPLVVVAVDRVRRRHSPRVTGAAGQTLTRVAHDRPGSGGRHRHGHRYRLRQTKGIYVTFCVVPPPGQLPTPCGGGIDLTGTGGGTNWVSSDPPIYATGLTTPYGPGGTFSVGSRWRRR